MAQASPVARTLAFVEKHRLAARISRLTVDGAKVSVEFFAPGEQRDVKQPAKSPAAGPVDHAHAPEVEAAVAALDRAYEIDDDEPVRDVKSIIAEVDAAAKAGV